MIEGIVRPFQSPQVTQSGPIPIPSVGPTQPASLKWGAVGKLPHPVTTYSWKISSKDSETVTELSRSTDTVRVYNPQDSSQYADVQRTNKLVMSKTSSNDPFNGIASQVAAVEADFAAAFADFDAEIQSALNFDNFNAPQSQATYVFHPPA